MTGRTCAIRDETSIPIEGSFDYWFEIEGRFWSVPVLGRLLADSYARDDRQMVALLKAKASNQGRVTPLSQSGA